MARGRGGSAGGGWRVAWKVLFSSYLSLELPAQEICEPDWVQRPLAAERVAIEQPARIRLIAKTSDFFFQRRNSRILARAIEAGDTAGVQRWVPRFSDLDQAEVGGVTFLFWALMQDNLEAFQLLLERGADPEATLELADQRLAEALVGETNGGYRFSYCHRDSILFGIVRNQPFRCRYLPTVLAHRPDVDRRDQAGQSLLHLVLSQAGHVCQTSSLQRLIASGIDVNARNPAGETPLVLAWKAGNELNCRRLLEAGADPRLADASGRNLIDYLELRRRAGEQSTLDGWLQPWRRRHDWRR
jgi:ankyrin repeat protein